MPRPIKIVLAVLGVLAGVFLLAALGAGVSQLVPGLKPVVAAIPALVGGLIGAWVLITMTRTMSREQLASAARNTGSLVGAIFPLRPFRDAVGAIPADEGGPVTRPKYGIQRATVQVDDGVLRIRLPKSDQVLLEAPASRVHDLGTWDLPVGGTRFPTLHVEVETSAGPVVVPLSFTANGAPTEKPEADDFDVTVANLRQYLWR